MIRYDDQCGNGHNTFSITGYIREGWHSSGDCIHDKIIKYYPELSHLIKWHLCSADCPLHYVANTLYFVDEHGPTHGFIYYTGKSDPLEIENKGERLLGYKRAEIVQKCEGQPGYRVEWDQKTAKKRELDSARHSAIWPEATDEELTAPNLKDKLIERLPALMKDFKEMVESLGFIY